MSGHHGRGVCVDRMPNVESAARRAVWLAELADALDSARYLVKEFESEGRIEAIELHARIEAARFEVQALRLRRSQSNYEDSDPEWSKDIPWKRSA